MANRKRGHIVQSDFASKILRSITVGAFIKTRDHLFYQMLHELGLDEMDAASQMQAILACVNYHQLLERYRKGDLTDQSIKMQDKIFAQLEALKKRSNKPQETEGNDLQSQLSAILEGR